jgi:hypothetical protein
VQPSVIDNVHFTCHTVVGSCGQGYLQPYSVGTFKLLFSVVNLWRDGVGVGVPLATGGPFECGQQRSTLLVALRAGDGLALLPWVSSPARSVHDRWPFAPFSRRFPENRMLLKTCVLMNFNLLNCLPWLLAATVTINWQTRIPIIW